MTPSYTKAELAGLSLSPAEIEALLDVPEGRVRKELEHGLLRSMSRGATKIDCAGAVYLRALGVFVELEPPVEWRRRFLESVRNALAHAGESGFPEDMALGSDLLHLRFKSVAEDVCNRLIGFYRWRDERVARDPEILNGEAAFGGTRLSVRHVGEMANRGESVAAILEDYPYLNARDVEFARLFARAYPRVGRPRESAKVPPG